MIPLGYPVAASACLRRRVVVLCRHFSYHVRAHHLYDVRQQHDARFHVVSMSASVSITGAVAVTALPSVPSATRALGNSRLEHAHYDNPGPV